MSLYENYKDDILNTSVNEKRKYRMINNGDGTVSFEDVTSYTQVGDTFGAADVNAITIGVNKIEKNVNGFSFNVQETAILTYVDKNTLMQEVIVGEEWNGAYAFAQQMSIGGDNENVVSITVSPLVMNGTVTVYAHSDGAFTSGAGGVLSVSILLVKKN